MDLHIGMMKAKVTLDMRTVIFTVLLLLGLYAAYLLRSVLLVLFIAYIINAGLRPIVRFFERQGFSRGLSILFTYLIIFGVLTVLGLVVVNTTVVQIRAFVSTIDSRADSFVGFINTNLPFVNQFIDLEEIRSNLQELASLQGVTSNEFYAGIFQSFNVVGGINIIGRFVGGIFSFISIVIISVYMLRNKKNIYEPLLALLPQKYEKRFNPVLTKIEASLGNWLLGQVALMAIIGVASYLIVLLPGVVDSTYPLARYALVIAIIAGLLEAVPNLGPLITLVFALLITIVSGAGLPAILYIVVTFTLLQQLEGVFIVPTIMKKAVDLHPILSIVGVLAGFQLWGPIGALLSIPIIGAAQIVLLTLLGEWKRKSDVE